MLSLALVGQPDVRIAEVRHIATESDGATPEARICPRGLMRQQNALLFSANTVLEQQNTLLVSANKVLKAAACGKTPALLGAV